MRLANEILTSYSSATRHEWLNLFSSRHEWFTSDSGLTRTRLVSCVLLTSLMTARSAARTTSPPRLSRANVFFLEQLTFSAALPCGRHYFSHTKWLPIITDYRDTAALKGSLIQKWSFHRRKGCLWLKECHQCEVNPTSTGFRAVRRESRRQRRINGTYSQSFAPNCLRDEQIGVLFNSHSFCTVVVDVESLEDLCGRKKGQLCPAIAFRSSLGALQKWIHVHLSCYPKNSVFSKKHLRIDFGGSSGM